MMQFHLTTQPSRERVLHYYAAMNDARVPPSAHTYKLLLDAWAVLPPTNLAEMERVFAQLCRDRFVKVQGTHWASLISAYGIYAGDLAKAIATFDSIPSHRVARVDLSAEPVVWEAILNVVATNGTLEQLEEIRQKMAASGVRPTAYVYNVLIGGYARAGQIEKAREVFNAMGDSVTGVAAPNNHPTLLTSSGHVKPATTTDAPTTIVYREPSTYEAMIRAEVAEGNRAAAEVVLAKMEERRYPVAVYMRARGLLEEIPQAPASAANAAPAAAPAVTVAPHGVFAAAEPNFPVQNGVYAPSQAVSPDEVFERKLAPEKEAQPTQA